MTSSSEGVGKLGLSYVTGGCKMVQLLWKSPVVSQKVKVSMWPSLPLRGMFVHTKPCTQMSTAARFYHRSPEVETTNEQINDMECLCTMKYFSATERNADSHFNTDDA